jgi:hypothetical protein
MPKKSARRPDATPRSPTLLDRVILIEQKMATKDDFRVLTETTDSIAKRVLVLTERTDFLAKGLLRTQQTLAETQTDVRQIKEDMATKMATKDDVNRILDRIDQFAGNSRDVERNILVHNHRLTEVESRLTDHDRRFAALESK